MECNSLYQTQVEKIAELDGFLRGISFLNKDHRSNFAEAMIVDTKDSTDILKHIRSQFSQISDLEIKFDETFDGSLSQLEQETNSLLLVDSHVANEHSARDLRSYLTFKILDRIYDPTEEKVFEKPVKIVGAAKERQGSMTFYFFRSPVICFLIYFYKLG